MFWKKKEEVDPRRSVKPCEVCRHLVRVEDMKEVRFDYSECEKTAYYCPEHRPAYDRVVIRDYDLKTFKPIDKEVKTYYLSPREIECDEKGKIIIPKNIYEGKH